MNKNKFRPKYIFPKTSFWIGMGSVLNISGNYFEFNGFDDGYMIDRKAIESDWKAIGRDISNATNKLDEKFKKVGETTVK